MIQLMGIEALSRTGRINEVMEEHQKILSYLKEGRGKEARQAMEYHLDRSKEAVIEGSTANPK